MVRRCAEAATPESALATLERDAMRVRAWTPDGPAMRDLVDAVPAAMVEAPMVASLTASLAAFAQTMAAVPDDLRPAPDERGLESAFERFVAPAWRRGPGRCGTIWPPRRSRRGRRIRAVG